MASSCDHEHKVELIATACRLLAEGAVDDAISTIRVGYPIDQAPRTPCGYSGPRIQEPCEKRRRPTPPLTRVARVFARDGYVDRYTGRRVIDPGVLRYLGHVEKGPLRTVLPYHVNGGRGCTSRSGGRHICHQAGFELFASYEHIRPIAAGGLDAEENLATAAFDTNAEKGTVTWEIAYPPGGLDRWDGLVGWFLRVPVESIPREILAWRRVLASVHAPRWRA